MSEYKDNDLQVKSCTLTDLFNTSFEAIIGTSIQGQLTIPEYQRPYVWREKHINRLLNDFSEYYENTDVNKPFYYLGSIILHQDGDKLKIIDGQQRITTLLLIQKFINSGAVSGIEYSANKSIESINYNLSYLKSIFNKEIFEYRDKDIFN